MSNSKTWVTLLNSLYVSVTFWTFPLCHFRFYLKVAVNAHTSPVQTSASHILLSAGTSVFFVLTDALLCLIRDVTFHWVAVTFLLCHGRCFVCTGLRSTTETRASGHVVLARLAVMVSAGSQAGSLFCADGSLTTCPQLQLWAWARPDRALLWIFHLRVYAFLWQD